MIRKLKALKASALALWASLPLWAKPVLKTAGMAFLGAASGVLHHAWQNRAGCQTAHCWLGYFVAAFHAGALAVGAYLMKSPLAKDALAQLNQVQAQTPLPKFCLLAAFLVLASSPSRAQLPNPKLTPGAVRTTNTKEVCSTTTKQFRNTTEAMKKQACAEYKIADCPKEKVMEIDHLISLELGGADEIANLWPQLATYPDGSPGFHVKDKLENDLHRLVCAGKMKLTDAQECIRTDWIACAKKVAAQ